MIRKMLSCVLIALIASALPIPSSAATSSILAPKQWVLDQLVVSNASDFVTSNTNSIAYKAAHGGGGGGSDTNAVKNIVTNTLSTIHINGQQLAENVTITTFSPFKTTWPTGSGINTFFSSVARDADAKDGTAFLGQLSGTSTPWETGNCEATLQVMKNTMGRLIYIVSVYSTDIYPYYWFNMSVSGGPGNGWRCYAPKSTTLSGYGITDAYTKNYVEATFVHNNLSNRIDGIIFGPTNYPATREPSGFDIKTLGYIPQSASTGLRTVEKLVYNKDTSYNHIISESTSKLVFTNGANMVFGDRSGMDFYSNSVSVVKSGARMSFNSGSKLNLFSSSKVYIGNLNDVRVGGTNYDTATNVVCILERCATNAAASVLIGKTYDFANGSNFTKRVYEALTNVIQSLGGTVTNAPSFN